MKRLLLILLLPSLAMAQYNGTKPPLGSQINWSHPLAKGLVGCWLMNEGRGTRFSDVSGNNKVGVFAGNTAWLVSQYGPALTFDGDADYVNIGAMASLSLKPFTVSVLTKSNNLTEDHLIVHQGPALAPTNPFSLYFDDVVSSGADAGVGNTDTISILSYDGTTTHRIGAPTNTNTGQWLHIVGVVNPAPGSLAIYVDGRLRISNVKAWNGSAATTGSWGFGDSVTVPGANCLNGAVGNVQIWDRVLTDSEIQQLYLDPFGMFQPSLDIVTTYQAPAAGGAAQVIIIASTAPIGVILLLSYLLSMTRRKTE